MRSSADDHKQPGMGHYAIRITGDSEELNRLKRQLTTNNITIDELEVDSDEPNDTSFYIYDSDGIKIQVLLSKQ